MIYKLLFKAAAKKEWDALDNSIKKQFKKKLKEILNNPHIPSSKLRGLDDCYKIKLRSSGCRIVYQVRDYELKVIVVAVGKRERNLAYKAAQKRL